MVTVRNRLSIIIGLAAAIAAAEEPPYTVHATVRNAAFTNDAEWLIVADLASPSVATGVVHVGYGLLCASSFLDGDQFAVAEIYTQTVSYLEARLVYTPAPGCTNTAPRVGGPTPGIAEIFEAYGTNSVPFPGLPGVGAPSEWLRWTSLNLAIRRLILAAGSGGSASTNGVPGPTGPAGTSATITVSGTVTVPAGHDNAVTNEGSASAASLRFYLAPGRDGTNGAPGEVGPVGPAGSNAVGMIPLGYMRGLELSAIGTNTMRLAVGQAVVNSNCLITVTSPITLTNNAGTRSNEFHFLYCDWSSSRTGATPGIYFSTNVAVLASNKLEWVNPATNVDRCFGAVQTWTNSYAFRLTMKVDGWVVRSNSVVLSTGGNPNGAYQTMNQALNSLHTPPFAVAVRVRVRFSDATGASSCYLASDNAFTQVVFWEDYTQTGSGFYRMGEVALTPTREILVLGEDNDANALEVVQYDYKESL